MESNDWLIALLGLSHEVQVNVAYTLLVLIALSVMRFIALKIIYNRAASIDARYQWRRIINYITSIIGTLIIGRIWFEAFQSLSTFLGLVTAGLAIALKEPVVNLVGWIFIIFRKPFEIGDRIEIGDKSGDVVDQRVFQFSILEIGNWVNADQSTGRIIHVPNGLVFNQMVANYSRGLKYLWNEMPVLITFESDWEKAKQILIKLANQHVGEIRDEVKQKLAVEPPKYLIRYSILDPAVYTCVKDSGVLLTIRYLCEPHQRRNTEQIIWEGILREFAKHSDIEFAYQTQRFFYTDSKAINKQAKNEPDNTQD